MEALPITARLCSPRNDLYLETVGRLLLLSNWVAISHQCYLGPSGTGWQTTLSLWAWDMASSCFLPLPKLQAAHPFTAVGITRSSSAFPLSSYGIVGELPHLRVQEVASPPPSLPLLRHKSHVKSHTC